MFGEPNRAASRSLAGAIEVRLAALVASAATVGLGAADAGYFPRQWGWGALALLWISILALLLRSAVRLGPLELAFLGTVCAFAAWIAASNLWSTSVPASTLEFERTLVYAGGVLAVLVLARRRAVAELLGAVLGAITLLAAYALATKLFPEQLGIVDPMAGNRLSEPIGYWNGLGVFAAIGSLLALGFAARGEALWTRAAGASVLVILVPTMYFTFGRGAWIALGLGLLATVALDPKRLQLIAAFATAIPAPAIALWLASRSDALTGQRPTLSDASREGHRLALALLVCAAVAAVLASSFAYIEREVFVPRLLRLGAAGVLAVSAVGAVAVVFTIYGSPVALATRGYDAFRAPPPEIDGDLERRLFSFSGNSRAEHWEVAWHSVQDHPVLGSGAGTFEYTWNADRPILFNVRDAHNLYLETLMELGPIGLLLLLTALMVPVAAAIKVRHYQLAAPAFGAYATYLVHAGVDWDWELPAVTLAALFTGAALVVAARKPQVRPLPRAVVSTFAATALLLAGFAFVGFIGNSAIHVSSEALLNESWIPAEREARKATAWAPWSSEPWQLLGEAQLGQGDQASARESFAEAIAKDPHNYALWVDLALVTEGAERERALDRAASLNPLDPGISDLRETSGDGG
jgi:O-antigen ligase